MASSRLAEEYPLHWAVWHNELQPLRAQLAHIQVSFADMDGAETAGQQHNALEKKDPRGRTPLMLAVTLGHFECARLLLDANADANAESRTYWSVVHEATATGDPELLRAVLHHRTYQRTVRTALAFRRLLNRLKDGPDFYAEIHWKFSSWVPFVTQMCPSDTYKVYKSGSRVRIDTTLAGINASAIDAGVADSTPNTNYWQRANLSYRFSFDTDAQSGARVPVMSVVDHDRRLVQVMPTLDDEDLNSVLHSQAATSNTFAESRPSAAEVAARLTAPITTTYVDIDKIAFERSKNSGVVSWLMGSGSEGKRDTINGYDCSVCEASNVELVTKTRTEHLSAEDKRANDEQQRSSGSVAGLNVMEMLFGKQQERSSGQVLHADCVTASNPFGIGADEYFNSYIELGSRDIGRPRDVTRRSNSFKATLWLAEQFPLDLQEQVIPIIDLMASSNAHFARLRNFISLQLPAGFPVRIELPLFHVFTSEVTFGNVQAQHTPVQGVQVIQDADNVVCVIDDSVFEVDPSYARVLLGEMSTGGGGGRQAAVGVDEEDMMMQLAIQQSLLQPTDELQAAAAPAVPQPGLDDQLLQQRELMFVMNAPANNYTSAPTSHQADVSHKRTLDR